MGYEIEDDATERKNDNVKSPNHYKVGGIEVIDILKAKLSHDEFNGYCKGNIIKYLFRAEHKGNAVQDYAKAGQYMLFLINAIEGKNRGQ